MNRILTYCAATMLAASLMGCNQTPAPAADASATAANHDADVKAIRDGEAQWNQDYASKDASKLVAHYADDAVLMTPGMAAMSGKAAIQKGLEDFLKDPALALHFQPSTVDIANSGDLAYSRGTYTLTMTNPKTKKPMDDHGSYVTDYRKQADGSWKAVADISVSEVPIGGPTAPMKKK